MKSYTLDDLARMIVTQIYIQMLLLKTWKSYVMRRKNIILPMVAINQVQSGLCAKLLEGTDIHTGAAISFPLGQTTIASKVFDTKDAIANGANEIDYVVNQTEIKASNWDYIKDEMSQIVAACHEKDVTCKVIFENCYLNDEEKIKLCEIAKEVKPDFIKTSTGSVLAVLLLMM